MAGKSRRKRSRQSPSRKTRAQKYSAVATPTPAAHPVAETAAQPETTSLPATARPAPPTRFQTIQFPYIGTELRIIGILAGIMLIVLITLYFTLV
jgi:hypothetical protein